MKGGQNVKWEKGGLWRYGLPFIVDLRTRSQVANRVRTRPLEGEPPRSDTRLCVEGGRSYYPGFSLTACTQLRMLPGLGGAANETQRREGRREKNSLAGDLPLRPGQGGE
jgi:hypothetical protein